MSEWKEYMLKDLCDKITDGSHSSPKAQNIGYPMFSVKDMEEYGFCYKDCKRISEDDFGKMKSSGCVPEKDDILIAKDGSYLKQIFICRENKEEAILSSIAIFRPNKNIVEPKFLMYLLKSPLVFNYIKTNCVSGSAIPRIVLKSFKDVKMSIPDSIEKQRSIASILSSLDDKIETNRKICANLEAQAQALFKHWFIDFAPFKDGKFVDSELGMIPEGWRVGKIQDLASKMASGGTPTSTNRDYYGGNILWYSTKELTDNFLLESEKHITQVGLENSSAKLFPKDTVLMAIYAAPTVGRLGILTQEASFNQAAVGIVAKEEVGYEYIYSLLLFERKNLNNLACGAAQQNLNVGIVKNYKCVIPTRQGLATFREQIIGIFLQIKKLQQESSRLSSLRDTLLPKLMSGQIKV